MYFMEEWRVIPGHTKYEASSLGRVRYAKTGRVRKPALHRRGYHMVSLRPDGALKDKNTYIHKLVALAFLGPNPFDSVNHKDFDKANNAVVNLEYMSRIENIKHAHRAGRIPIPRMFGHKNSQGTKHGRSKLTDADIREIRSSNESKDQLAIKFNVCAKHIGDIISRKRWSHIDD